MIAFVLRFSVVFVIQLRNAEKHILNAVYHENVRPEEQLATRINRIP